MPTEGNEVDKVDEFAHIPVHHRLDRKAFGRLYLKLFEILVGKQTLKKAKSKEDSEDSEEELPTVVANAYELDFTQATNFESRDWISKGEFFGFRIRPC